jgi:hypothetical protein
MNNMILDVVVRSAAAERFDSQWREQLVSTLLSGNVAVTDVGGGTDMSTDMSENEYEIIGRSENVTRALELLEEHGYTYQAFSPYGDVVRESTHA